MTSCAGCKKPHEKLISFHHGSDGDVFHLCPDCDSEVTRAAEDETQSLLRRIDRQTDWYQQRFDRLRRWVKEEVEPLSKEVAHRYFAICANGSPAPHEQADWTETMHGLTLRAERAEQEVARLRKLIETATPTLEWAQKPVKIELPAEALAKMQALVEAAPAPSPRGEVDRALVDLGPQNAPDFLDAIRSVRDSLAADGVRIDTLARLRELEDSGEEVREALAEPAPETCDDCGAIVGGNPACGACCDWVRADARKGRP